MVLVPANHLQYRVQASITLVCLIFIVSVSHHHLESGLFGAPLRLSFCFSSDISIMAFTAAVPPNPCCFPFSGFPVHADTSMCACVCVCVLCREEWSEHTLLVHHWPPKVLPPVFLKTAFSPECDPRLFACPSSNFSTRLSIRLCKDPCVTVRNALQFGFSAQTILAKKKKQLYNHISRKVSVQAKETLTLSLEK